MGEELIMPTFSTRIPSFKPPKLLKFDWDNFKGGLNTMFRDFEIDKDELSQAQNIQLVGKGVPTKAPGTNTFFLSGAGGSVRGLEGFYQKDGTNELLAVNDNGLLTKKSNASYAEIAGVSWISGNNVEMSQLDDKMYIVGGSRELARYDGSTLVGFPTISQPTATFATQISGISGANTVSYRLSHTTAVGETASADAYTAANQPKDLIDGAVLVSWTNASTASGIRKATNIYGRAFGIETFLAQVDGEASEWIDDGSSTPELFSFSSQIVDSTGGINAKHIKRFQDRLIYAGVANEPTRLMISARFNNHETFDIGLGGGFIDIEPNSGDEIIGIETKADKIIVFKQRSIWQVTIGSVQIGNFFLIEPVAEIITRSIGCASNRSIQHVENDLLFLASGGRGVFVLGNEPGIIGDILRTNEVSFKVRPFFENLTATEETDSTAAFFNNKYHISIPGKDQTMVFDRERNSWVGPWTFDSRVLHVYYDSDNKPHLLGGEDDQANVIEISNSNLGHKGVAMDTILRTRKHDWGDWTQFENIQNIFSRWRSVVGDVNADIRLEQRNGNTITAKSFSITSGSGNSGWGADVWANTQWGDTEEAGVAQDLNEIVKQAKLNKAARNFQVIVKTDGLNDNYELLGFRGEAQRIGLGFRPSSWRVAVFPPLGMIGHVATMTPSNQIFPNIIQGVVVNMMDVQKFIAATLLTLLAISFFYLLSKRGRKSSSISDSIGVVSMNVGWVKRAYFLFSEFLLSCFRMFASLSWVLCL